MRRKMILFLLVFVTVGFSSFADTGLEIGPSAMLKYPLAVSDDMSSFSGIGIEDFKFGADVEFGLGPVMLGALIDFKPGAETESAMIPPSVEAFVTAGLLLDLAIVRIGASVGPTFVVDIPNPQSGTSAPSVSTTEAGDVGFGLGVKANADLVLGPVILRLNVISGFDLLRMAVAEDALEYMDLKVGMSLLLGL